MFIHVGRLVHCKIPQSLPALLCSPAPLLVPVPFHSVQIPSRIGTGTRHWSQCMERQIDQL